MFAGVDNSRDDAAAFFSIGSCLLNMCGHAETFLASQRHSTRWLAALAVGGPRSMGSYPANLTASESVIRSPTDNKVVTLLWTPCERMSRSATGKRREWKNITKVEHCRQACEHGRPSTSQSAGRGSGHHLQPAGAPRNGISYRKADVVSGRVRAIIRVSVSHHCSVALCAKHPISSSTCPPEG